MCFAAIRSWRESRSRKRKLARAEQAFFADAVAGPQELFEQFDTKYRGLGADSDISEALISATLRAGATVRPSETKSHVIASLIRIASDGTADGSTRRNAIRDLRRIGKTVVRKLAAIPVPRASNCPRQELDSLYAERDAFVKEAGPLLVQCLDSEDELLVIEAAETLAEGELHNFDAKDKLVQLVQVGSSAVRAAAIRALGPLAHVASKEAPLFAILDDASDDPKLRQLAGETIARHRLERPMGSSQISQSPSPTDYGTALKLYRKCRADYDIAQNDIVLRGPDKSGLRQVLSALNGHLSRVPDDVDALLLRAGTIETLYDKGLYDQALEDLRHALDLAPTNARAYVIRGSILYSQCGGGFDAPPEVEEKKVRLLIADLHKALELDPQGCWDLSFSKYLRSNAGLRKELAANESHLQKILAKRELQARPAASQPSAQTRPQPFKEVSASTAEEATRILCEDALQAATLNDEPKARLAALEFAANHVVWSGPLQDLKGVVLNNARRMSSYPGFMNFQIKLYENGDAAHASAIYQRGGGFTFRPLRVWKSETLAFAAGDDSFEA